MNKLSGFNDRLADMLADWLSTMAMFYGLCFLIFAVLYWQLPDGPIGWLTFVVQTFFQGVALPVLGFVAKKEGTWTRRILVEIRDTILTELALMKQQAADQHAQLVELHRLSRGLLPDKGERG